MSESICFYTEHNFTFAEVPAIDPIVVVGQNHGEHGVVLSGGATVQITENVDIFADGGYRWHDNGDEYTLGAGARMTW